MISIFAGCLANHDRAHSQRVSLGEPPFYGVPQDAGGGGGTHKTISLHLACLNTSGSEYNFLFMFSNTPIIRPENSIISVDHTSIDWCSCMKKASTLDVTETSARVAVESFSFGAVAGATVATC